MTNFSVKNDFENCLDGAVEIDYYHLFGQKRFDQLDYDLAKFMAATANDPNILRHDEEHMRQFSTFKKEIPIFKNISPETYNEFVSSALPAVKTAYEGTERIGEIRGHAYFLSNEIKDGPDAITPDGIAEQYKTVTKLHENNIWNAVDQYGEVMKEHNMYVHIYFEKYHDQVKFEIFKIEHPELFKNIVLHDMSKEKPVTEEETLKIIEHAKNNPEYFANRAKSLSESDSWFAKLLKIGKKK